jgi:hypothetical protein
MEYTTLKELKDAKDSGELKLANNKIVIDNDQVFLYVDDIKVFDMHPADLLEQALDYLELPHEPV